MINVKAKYRYVQMKAVVLYKGVLTLKYVNETLVLGHSNEKGVKVSKETVVLRRWG